MIEAGELHRIQLDKSASEPQNPYGIITVDCTGPREIDDGIAVELLDDTHELYRVNVFTVDTSGLYSDEQTVKKVLQKTEARYLNPQSEAEGYEAMLDEHTIRNLEFVAKAHRSALVVSFNVGPSAPPSDIAIQYGKVEVTKNFRYDKFGRKCRYDDGFRKYGRAAAAILKQLHDEPGETEQIYKDLIHVPNGEKFRRGSDINQTFMVAANYLVAKSMQQEPLAIYRTHDLEDVTFDELISSRVARFSTKPGPHDGLNLDVYTRVTSPLRRAEDFFMHGLLRARYEGRPFTSRDSRLVNTAVRRLNQRVIANAFNGRVQMNQEDSWRGPRASKRRALTR